MSKGLAEEVAAPSCSVSVVILTMSRPQYLERAIESVFRQTFPSWELIVVHDGTDPRIAPVVMVWAKRDPRVRYFHRPVPGNIADALNYGIRQSRGRYIAVLDDDDEWIHREKLRLQLDRIESSSRILAVGGGAIVVNGHGVETMRYQKPIAPEECRRRALLANPIIHSTVLYRRDAAEAVGLYDAKLAGYQDWDLWLKLMQQGDVVNVPEYLATYRVWDGGGTSRHVMENAHSAVRIVRRHGGYYRGDLLALAIGFGYMIFALFPDGVRRRAYQSLSRWKKRLFSISRYWE